MKKLTKGTRKVILSTKDPQMALALNDAVAAIRELQEAVVELQSIVSNKTPLNI
jgi:hypothetical protein